MGETAKVGQSTFDYYLRPGLPAKGVESLTRSGSLLQDVLEIPLTICDYVPYFTDDSATNAFAKDTSARLETIKLGLAIPRLISGVNDLRQNLMQLGRTDDPKLSRKTLDNTMGIALCGAQTVQFLDKTSLMTITEVSKQLTKKIFWGALLYLEGGSIFKQIAKIEKITEKLEKVKDVESRSILEDKLNLAHLNVLKDVTVVAMACISLTSLLFASMASGVLFSPPVFLGLSTTWLILNFVTYFYSLVIKSQESALPAGKLV